MSKTFEAFRLYYAPELPEIPKHLAIRAIREAVIEFCKKTEILIVDADPIPISEDTSEYDIEVDGDYVPVTIDSAFLGEGESTDAAITITSKRSLEQSGAGWKILTTSSDITHCFLGMSGQVRVYPVPENDLDDSLYLSIAVTPTRDATEMDDDLIYDDFIEDIKCGVLARLYAMRKMAWHDPKEASAQRYDFDCAIVKARSLAMKGKSNISMSASYGGPAH